MNPTPRTVPYGSGAGSVEYTSLPLSVLRKGDRRLEGETYLTGGYSVRLRIAKSGVPFVPMDRLAGIWQPSRLKGYTVSPEHGVPFYTASQAFEIRPLPRKWIAPRRTSELEKRYVNPGWILVTCSGNIGDVTISHAPHFSVVISHDLLRVKAKDESQLGYLYTFLRSRFGRSMLRSSRYGSIIKHLEPEHLAATPVPLVAKEIYRDLKDRVQRVFSLREEAFRLAQQAETRFAAEIGMKPEMVDNERGYSVSATRTYIGARRLDAHYYNPLAEAVLETLKATGKPLVPMKSLVDQVFGVPRFKHVYADRGIPYLDSEDLFKLNPELTKYIPSIAKKDVTKYFVKRGWLLMACSGQIYWLNGNIVLADTWHENKIVSNHVLRIVPSARPDGVRPGYLQTVLGHPLYGRPLVLRLAFGTEVPEIAPEDLIDFPVVRLNKNAETEIAECVERASSLRVQADEEENTAVALLEQLLGRLLGGDVTDLDLTSEVRGGPTQRITGGNRS